MVREVLEAFAGKGQALLLLREPSSTWAVLWKANYKSAELYVVEAKLMHVEMGCEWSAQLRPDAEEMQARGS